MANPASLAAGLMAAASLVLAATPALAERDEPGGSSGWSLFQGDDIKPQRLQKLHDALNLKPDQEADWKKYTEALQSPKPADRPRKDWGNMTAPERAQLTLDAAKRNQEQLSKQVDAMKTFYGTLSQEQKKTFDQFHGGARSGKGS